jgi:antiviral defense system Shedu protein SduA
MKFIDIGLAWTLDGEDYLRKVRCLWIFADAEQLNIQTASSLAFQDYSTIVSRALGGIPISMLARTLVEYHKLLEKKNLKEYEIQGFLQHNFVILEHSYKRIFTKDELRKFKMPESDFLVETYDGKYVIVELESPQDRLFTDEKPPNPSRELRNAQTQIQDYLSYFRNNILYCRNTFPEISVENVSGLVIIGRRKMLNEKQKRSFNQLVGTTQVYHISTYDELFQRTNALLKNISSRYGIYLS